MTNNNDDRILLLKKQIQSKKEKLGKTVRFQPITTCSIELDGERYNLHVLNKEKLTLLVSKLQSYLMASKTLDLAGDFTISGHHIAEWITDIVNKIKVLNHKDEEKNLKLMEDKLVKLLSEGKKVELEIDEIENLLK